MTWLQKLYPPRWRRRYEEEFVALIASQRFSFLTVLMAFAAAQPVHQDGPQLTPYGRGVDLHWA